jgi:hypothetical protein
MNVKSTLEQISENEDHESIQARLQSIWAQRQDLATKLETCRRDLREIAKTYVVLVEAISIQSTIPVSDLVDINEYKSSKLIKERDNLNLVNMKVCISNIESRIDNILTADNELSNNYDNLAKLLKKTAKIIKFVKPGK